jgi:hypothetical protein
MWYATKVARSITKGAVTIPMKLFRLIKMCLNETYSKVHIGKHLSDKFPIQNGLPPPGSGQYHNLLP